ncbi:MAG: NBR1-Ig-like domain-containing protein [Anaerolineales bacterium]|nr:NBR1-Ig-like domain-containing protein [Anaerolineales bacterium]
MKTRWFALTSMVLMLGLLILPRQVSFAGMRPTSDDLVFDFTANALLAEWRSGAGTLPFPGTSGDHRGYALTLDAPVQEDSTVGAPGLLTVPQNKYDGYIQGIYPEFTVQKGDRFQVTVGCEAAAKNCYVTYRLDYITSSGVTKIFWSWKEKHEGRTYHANLDLSRLAGQKVRFVLTLLASGPAANDRALWVSPRIVRPGNGKTPQPTLTPTATPFNTPPPIPPAGCDRASFVADVTVRDGTAFAPRQTFTKTWRLKNTGTCAWTRDYALVFYSGELMGAPTLVNLPWRVEPGAMVDVTVNAVAPASPGQYRSDWILRNASGQLFGIGPKADKPFWMLINVIGTPPQASSGYDFAANLCAAEWRSGAGILACPFSEGDARGFALTRPARMEDGTTTDPAILTHPQNKYDGYLQGTFPTFTVQPGDRFQAIVGCEHNTSCYVTFRLEYLTPGGAPRIFWKWSEKNEGKTYRVDLDLSPLAGQSVRFVLTTLAAGPATNDRAVWGAPRIVRPGLPVATPTPLPSQTWPLFLHAPYAFELRYPPEGYFTAQLTNFGHLELPKLQGGTNLSSKYMEYRLVNGSTTCTVNDTFGPPIGVLSTQEVVVNGLTFTRIDGLEASMNHTYRYTYYTARSAKTCLTLLFLLRAGTPEVYDPPRPPYDYTLEASTFTEMMNTFAWPALPSGQVTNVTLSSTLAPVSCTTGLVQADLNGIITTDGAARVVYHWEILGDSVNQVTPDQILLFGEAASQAVTTTFSLPCGNHVLRLVTIAPNENAAQVNAPLNPPEATPLPSFTSPYAVIGLPPESALNLYAAPGTENPIAGSLPSNARNIERGTTVVTIGSERWVEARLPGQIAGWVKDSHLTESIAPETFVTDARPIQRIVALAQAMNQSDGNLFASLISPKRGVTIYYHGTWSNPVTYDFTRAQQAFTNPEIIHWGPEGASGYEAIGTFAEIIRPKLLDALNAPYQIHANTPLYAAMYVEPWPGIYQNLNYYAILKPPTPGLELDWRIWLAGFEYVDGVPYLAALLHYVWEP